MKTILLSTAFAVLTIVSCKKKEETKPIDTPITTPLDYTSLIAIDSTVAIGATTSVTANATGEGLSYTWSASAGDILGSGKTITYGAPTCCAGENTVTCVVNDASNNSQTKSITISVQ